MHNVKQCTIKFKSMNRTWLLQKHQSERVSFELMREYNLQGVGVWAEHSTDWEPLRQKLHHLRSSGVYEEQTEDAGH